MKTDICPSRDDAQPHIVEYGWCVFCLKSVIAQGPACPMTRNGLLYSVRIVEWVPGRWFVVQITNKDGSYTPLSNAFNSYKDAEQSDEWQDHQ